MATFISVAHKNVGKGFRDKPLNINGTEIRPQRNNWSCGPMSLRYCLLAKGIDADDRKIANWAGSTRSGTDEKKLARATKKLGMRLVMHQRRTPESAHKLILSCLKRGDPVLLCVENWSHWIAVVHHKRYHGFLVFNSNRPGPVIQLRPWKYLKRQMKLSPQPRFKHYFKHDKRPIYDVWTIRGPVQR